MARLSLSLPSLVASVATSALTLEGTSGESGHSNKKLTFGCFDLTVHACMYYDGRSFAARGPISTIVLTALSILHTIRIAGIYSCLMECAATVAILLRVPRMNSKCGSPKGSMIGAKLLTRTCTSPNKSRSRDLPVGHSLHYSACRKLQKVVCNTRLT